MPSTTVEIRGIDKTKAAFASVDKSMRTMKRSIGSLQSAVVGVIGSAALGGLVKTLADVSDRLGKTSARLGISTEDLQKFRFAAEQSGIEVSTFDTALQRFTRRSAEAAEGTGVAKDAFNELGISLKNNDGTLKSNTQLLKEVADAFKGTQSQADRVRLAFKLFDTEGVKMVNLLQQGSGAINAFGDQLESVNGVITDKSISAAEQFNDRLNIMANSARSFGARLIEVVNMGLNPFFESTEKLAAKVKDSTKTKIEALKIENDYVASILKEIPANASLETKINALNFKQRELNIRRILSIDLLDKLARRNKIGLRNDEESVKATNLQITGLSAYVAKLIEAIEIEKNSLRELNQLYLQNVASIETFYRTKDRLTKEDIGKHKEAIEQQQMIDMANVEYQLQINEKIKTDKIAKAEAEKALTAEVAKSTISTIQGMSATLASESRELFNLNKAASIAMVYINAAEAASKAYAQLGVFGPIAAGTIYALAIANIGKIASQNYPERQAGGDVRPGETYLVGERGPELLTMGQYGGNVTPNRNVGQGVIVNIYDGTGRKIDQAMSDLRVEVVERAQQFGEFAALESRQYTQNAFA